MRQVVAILKDGEIYGVCADWERKFSPVEWWFGDEKMIRTPFKTSRYKDRTDALRHLFNFLTNHTDPDYVERILAEHQVYEANVKQGKVGSLKPISVRS